MRFIEKILVLSWWELGEMSIDLDAFENGMGIFFSECLRRPATLDPPKNSAFFAKSRGDFKCKNLTKYFSTLPKMWLNIVTLKHGGQAVSGKNPYNKALYSLFRSCVTLSGTQGHMDA